jgi:DNA-binding protein H-NS
MTIDISSLNSRELLELAEKAKTEAAALRENEKRSARERVNEFAVSLGFSIAELFAFASKPTIPAGKTKGSKAAPKYRDPTTRQTWTGKGRQPDWFKSRIADGDTAESLLIDGGA